MPNVGVSRLKTRAACLVAPRKVEIVEKELKLRDDEILVKTHRASICGTDKMMFRGELVREPYPIFFGHEGGGTVEAVGPRVHIYKPGDRVMSFARHNTFADYFVARERSLQPVPSRMDMKVACLGEPLGCAMFSVLSSGVQLGDYVAVIGAGFAGQVMVQGAKKKGAYKVIAIDPVQGKLDLALRTGADYALNPATASVREEIQKITQGRGVDVVFEAAGTEASLNLATEIVKHNGILVLYSWIVQKVTLDISRWHHDGLDIRTTCLVHHSVHERFIWAKGALRPVLQGMIDVEPLLSAEFSLDRIQEAFEAIEGNPQLVKVVIKP